MNVFNIKSVSRISFRSIESILKTNTKYTATLSIFFFMCAWVCRICFNILDKIYEFCIERLYWWMSWIKYATYNRDSIVRSKHKTSVFFSIFSFHNFRESQKFWSAVCVLMCIQIATVDRQRRIIEALLYFEMEIKR